MIILMIILVILVTILTTVATLFTVYKLVCYNNKWKHLFAKLFIKIYKNYPRGNFIAMLDEYNTVETDKKDKVKVSVHRSK